MSLLIKFLTGLFFSASIVTANVPQSAQTASIGISGASLIKVVSQTREAISNTITDVPDVPFFSQFADISAPEWQKLGCGVASLAMIIEFYRPGIVSVDTLLREGIDAGAFIPGAGWSHKGLALLAKNYGLNGVNMTYDFSNLDTNAAGPEYSRGTAFAQFEEFVKQGPVIASVHYKLEPTNPIPHLIVVNGIDNNKVYYNDPASASGGRNISVQDFIKAWKKRFIVVRPY